MLQVLEVWNVEGDVVGEQSAELIIKELGDIVLDQEDDDFGAGWEAEEAGHLLTQLVDIVGHDDGVYTHRSY